MKIAHLVIIASLSIAAVTSLTLASNEAFRYSAQENWRRFTGDPGQVCFDYIRTSLKDPYSSRMAEYSVSPTDADTITVKYHAKNSFGAYIPGQDTCVLHKGTVNVEGTMIQRRTMELSAEGAKLRESNNCLRRRINLMREGKMSEAQQLNCGE